MLTENDVVQAVAAHLQSEGYQIDQELSTVKHGIDIIATKQTPRMRLLVEAKGGTSSKEFTSRYGKEFTQNQAKSHVSVAFYYAARLRQLHADEITRVALAIPDDKNHRSYSETPLPGRLREGALGARPQAFVESAGTFYVPARQDRAAADATATDLSQTRLAWVAPAPQRRRLKRRRPSAFSPLIRRCNTRAEHG